MGSSMKIDGPPLAGRCGSRGALSWLIGICLTLFLAISMAAGAAVISHGQRIAVLEIQMSDIRASLSNIDRKMDVMLRRTE